MKRTMVQLRSHYDIERSLASRLMRATRQERSGLYTQVYNELFERVPDHPQLTEREAIASRQSKARRQVQFLRSLCKPGNFGFLEVGPGDCLISLTVAESCPESKVYAVDVSDSITSKVVAPANFSLVISDGCSVSVPPASVDLAFSNQLMEHLHPEDAEEQLKNIFTALRPGGRYFCITPNMMSGPHDVSQHFSPVAQGFHLREYTVAELVALFSSAGFVNCRAYIGLDGRYMRIPLALATATEFVISLLPAGIRKPVGKFAPVRLMLGIRLLAQKPLT